MRQLQVQNVVIGAGTAGLAAYRAIESSGQSVLLIEGGQHGTTCARVGCMPSKLLIAAAEAVHGVARWDPFGIRLHGQVQVDGAAVLARVRRERDRFVGFVLEGVDRIPACNRITGYARFIAPGQLQVDEHTRIEFEKAVIATGSAPLIPDFLQPFRDRVVVNDDIFEWAQLPQSVAVFGTGVIGLELGQALHRLGVKVHLFGRGGRIGPLTDPALKSEAERCFEAELPFIHDPQALALSSHANGVRIQWQSSPPEPARSNSTPARSTPTHSIEVEWVVAATGRHPNLDQLGLETLGLDMNRHGVPQFQRDTLQCGSHPVFIAGDANQEVPLLHEAADEGRIAGENAARYPHITPGLRRSPFSIAFCDPQITTVGSNWHDLSGQQIVTGKVSFADQGRSRVMLRHQGLLHVYAARQNGRLLGAEMIGPEAEHLGHLLAWAHQLQLTIPQMLELPFYHPVVEEGLRTALRDAASQLSQPTPAQVNIERQSVQSV